MEPKEEKIDGYFSTLTGECIGLHADYMNILINATVKLCLKVTN